MPQYLATYFYRGLVNESGTYRLYYAADSSLDDEYDTAKFTTNFKVVVSFEILVRKHSRKCGPSFVTLSASAAALK